MIDYCLFFNDLFNKVTRSCVTFQHIDAATEGCQIECYFAIIGCYFLVITDLPSIENISILTV